MSVKKLLTLAAAGVATLGATAALAGGPDMMAPPAPVDYSGFYIDGDVGYADASWRNFWAGVYNPSPNGNPGIINGSTSSGGFTWGADLGYQFNRYFSAEAGWYWLPTVSGDETAVAPGATMAAGTSVKTRSWILYFAGKVSVPVWRNLDVFGKAGLVWRRLSYSGTAFSNAAYTVVAGRSNHYWAPFLGVGAQWWFTPAWSVNVQYLHVPSYTRVSELNQQAPKVDLIVAGVGYKFAS